MPVVAERVALYCAVIIARDPDVAESAVQVGEKC
jgi:hypothetical protein